MLLFFPSGNQLCELLKLVQVSNSEHVRICVTYVETSSHFVEFELNPVGCHYPYSVMGHFQTFYTDEQKRNIVEKEQQKIVPKTVKKTDAHGDEKNKKRKMTNKKKDPMKQQGIHRQQSTLSFSSSSSSSSSLSSKKHVSASYSSDNGTKGTTASSTTYTSTIPAAAEEKAVDHVCRTPHSKKRTRSSGTKHYKEYIDALYGNAEGEGYCFATKAMIDEIEYRSYISHYPIVLYTHEDVDEIYVQTIDRRVSIAVRKTETSDWVNSFEQPNPDDIQIYCPLPFTQVYPCIQLAKKQKSIGLNFTFVWDDSFQSLCMELSYGDPYHMLRSRDRVAIPDDESTPVICQMDEQKNPVRLSVETMQLAEILERVKNPLQSRGSSRMVADTRQEGFNVSFVYQLPPAPKTKTTKTKAKTEGGGVATRSVLDSSEETSSLIEYWRQAETTTVSPHSTQESPLHRDGVPLMTKQSSEEKCGASPTSSDAIYEQMFECLSSIQLDSSIMPYNTQRQQRRLGHDSHNEIRDLKKDNHTQRPIVEEETKNSEIDEQFHDVCYWYVDENAIRETMTVDGYVSLNVPFDV